MSIKLLVILFIIKLYSQNNTFKNVRLISKFMTLQPGKQAITLHILPNISSSTSNKTFGQLIDYNMRNIFLEKSC